VFQLGLHARESHGIPGADSEGGVMHVGAVGSGGWEGCVCGSLKGCELGVFVG
jgi:hypothetical protein